MNTIDRFLDKIELTDSCWEWKGHKDRNGYGMFYFSGVKVTAHRFSYEIHNECIPRGMEIDHLCMNTSCVNPSHLEVVTHKENINRSRRWLKC